MTKSLLACAILSSVVYFACGKASPTVKASQTIGTSGGTLTASSVTLNVPAGALSTNQTITVTQSTAAAPAGYTLQSPVYEFGPSGLAFASPITVTMHYSGTVTNPTIYWSNSSGGYDAQATTGSNGVASAQVTHFSSGFVGDAQGGASGTTGATGSTGPNGSSGTGATGPTGASGSQPTNGTSVLTLNAVGNLTLAATASDPNETFPNYSPGTVVSLSATLGASGHIVTWSSNVNDPNSMAPENGFTVTNSFTMGSGPATVTATSACGGFCSVTVWVKPSDANFGHVSVQADGGSPVTTQGATPLTVQVQTGNNIITLDAFDSANWGFAGWSSPVTPEQSDTCKGTMNAVSTDQNIEASFPDNTNAHCSGG